MNPHDLRALGLMVPALILRLLREGLVRRSMIWPTALTVGTLLATLAFFARLQGQIDVGVSPAVNAEIVAALESNGLRPIPVEDPTAAVAAGLPMATDGRTLVLVEEGSRTLQVESVLRQALDAPWRPERKRRLPQVEESARSGLQICRLVGVLFALYGVVFGLGMVARDRDDGSLEAELALPISSWVPAAARWLAGSAVLVLFQSLCFLNFAALMGLPDPAALIRHGAAAGLASTALGIGVVGRAGLHQSFTAPFATGSTVAAGLMALGAAQPQLGGWLPLASLATDSDGWWSLGLATLTGPLAAWSFARRGGRE